VKEMKSEQQLQGMVPSLLEPQSVATNSLLLLPHLLISHVDIQQKFPTQITYSAQQQQHVV